ncbi:hypothetical protein BH09ACT3_BH09ACT3_15210 [soil metagenome]
MSITLDDDDDEIPGLFPDGRPDPAYAAELGLVSAPKGKRAWAFVIDAAIFLAIVSPILIGSLPLFVGVVLLNPDPRVWIAYADFRLALILYGISQAVLLIFTVVQFILHGLKGFTLGKLALGLRNINVRTLGKPGFFRIVLRGLLFSAAFVVVPYLGAIPLLLSPLWDPQKRGRGWHDRMVGVWMVDLKAGFDPYNVKLMRLARKRVAAPKPEAEAVALPSLATGTEWGGPTFVPSARSSSGVILGQQHDAEEVWEAPELGGSGQAAAASSAVPPTTGVSPGPQVVAAPPEPPIPKTRPDAEPAPTQTGALLTFDDGSRLGVTGGMLIGRNPEPGPTDAGKQLMRLDDESRQVSKTHAELIVDAAGLWLVDRASSNGTTVTAPGGAEFSLDPWTRTRLESGSTVAIGGRSFTVTKG